MGAPFLFLVAPGSSGEETDTLALSITAQPSSALSGAVFVPVFRVELQVNGVATPAAATITAAIGSGSGTLGGTLSQPTGGGSFALFPDLTITGTGAHTVTFTATGYDAATSSSFTVSSVGTPLPPVTGDASPGRRRRVGWHHT